MTKLSGWQRFAAVLSAGFALLLAGCETTPAFQVAQPASRDGTVESIVQDTVQRGNAAAATIGGAVIGGLLGNQIGGGSGQTAATIVGAGAVKLGAMSTMVSVLSLALQALIIANLIGAAYFLWRRFGKTDTQ